MPRRVFDPAIAARKARNAEIFKETTTVIRTGLYTTPSGKQINLPSMQSMLDGAECWHDELPASDAPKVNGGTIIMVEENDCIEAARRLVEEGYRPALLNFASAGHPGGGVETGCRAQEETICRRSTLSRSIYSFDSKYAKKYGYEHRDGNNYPLGNLDFSIIYSPGVTVFREGLDCTFMEKPFQCAVITCAALNLRGKYELKLTEDGHMPGRAVEITRNKARAICRMGLRHGDDALVLGAFGCGAFKNPPEEVATIFKEVLEEDEFKDRFRLVTFSIIEDHNSGGVNLNAFRKVFNP